MSTEAEVKANVKHVVIMTLENRSFDEYFGTLNGARGFSDTTSPRPAPFTWDGVNYDGPTVFDVPVPGASGSANYLSPWPYDTANFSQATAGSNHTWAGQHESWNSGAMNGWLLPADPNDPTSAPPQQPNCLAYWTHDNVPYHFALAQAFTICDNYFCSALGPTGPNRLYLMSGGIGEDPPNVLTPPNPDLPWTSYAELLNNDGISWAVYDEDNVAGGLPTNDLMDVSYPSSACPYMVLNTLVYFSGWQNLLTTSGVAPTYRPGPGQFENDVNSGKLPQVSWIVPPWSQSEHPIFTPAAGIANVYSKVWALMNSGTQGPANYWEDTVLIVNYDENDGAFDHVAPITPSPGDTGEWLTVAGGLPSEGIVPSSPDYWPIGAGFRVPAFIISKWSVGGRVCRVPYDHTSTLKLLFLAFGVQPTLTDFRWFNFGDMSESLDFGNAQGAPEGLPTLDNVQAAAAAAVAQAAGGVAAAQETPPSPEPPFPPTALFPAKPLHPVGDNSPLIPPGCASVPLTVFKNAIKLASDRAQSLLGRR